MGVEATEKKLEDEIEEVLCGPVEVAWDEVEEIEPLYLDYEAGGFEKKIF